MNAFDAVGYSSFLDRYLIYYSFHGFFYRTALRKICNFWKVCVVYTKNPVHLEGVLSNDQRI